MYEWTLVTQCCAVSEIRDVNGVMRKERIIIITRMLLLQATVKRFQFDLYVNLEGQHMLISSWVSKTGLLEQIRGVKLHKAWLNHQIFMLLGHNVLIYCS